MKIPISKTELYALPYFAWNEYCYFMMDMGGSEDEAQYTPVQKTASLCFWYCSDVSEEGHEGYFYNRENVDTGELTKALRIIGVPEFADNFIKAVKYGPDDDYYKTDTWFEENEDTLVKAIEKYLRDNRTEFFEIVDEDYTMLQSSLFYRLGAIGAVFFLALMIIFIIIGTAEAFIAAAGFAIFSLATAYYALYAKIWKVTVKKDVLTVYKPFRRTKEYRFNEISENRYSLQGLVVYAHDRKVLTAGNSVSNITIFQAQLREDGKLKPQQYRNDFTIRPHNGNMLIGLFSILFLAAVYMWIVFWPEGTVDVIKHMITAAVVLVPLCLKSRAVLWRITVSDNTVTVKNLFVRKKVYKLRDIAEIHIGSYIKAYIEDKEIFRLSVDCIDASFLVERLKSEGIPFNNDR